MADLQKVSEIISDYIKTKGDIKADFSINETETNEITMKDGKFTLFRTLFDNDIAIKVIKDNKKAATCINKFDKETIEKAIDEVIASAEAGSPDECFDIAPGLEPREFFGKALTPDIEKLLNRTLELSEDIAAKHEKILLIEMFAKYVSSWCVIKLTDFGHFYLSTIPRFFKYAVKHITIYQHISRIDFNFSVLYASRIQFTAFI